MNPDAASARGVRLERTRVALLTNFVPPYRIPLFRALVARLGALRIFVSTEMEPNRTWPVEWADLDVEVLRTWTRSETSKHPHAFDDPTFVHVPIDALLRLWRMRPDVVVSGQLGAGSIFAALYCALRRPAKLVLWLTLSEVSELARGGVRRAVRRRLLARADAIMVNGESGARYAESLGAPAAKIFRVYQAVEASAFTVPAPQRSVGDARRLLFVGSSEPRKGLAAFLSRLAGWSAQNPDQPLELHVAGSARSDLGEDVPDLPPTLVTTWLGHLPYDALPALYAATDLLVFPTLADEWGLVVNEAMSAGVPVLGSVYSQAVLELVEDGRTGWSFRPDRDDSCHDAFDRALRASRESLVAFGAAGRERIAGFGIDDVAERMLAAIAFALEDHSSETRSSSPAYSE